MSRKFLLTGFVLFFLSFCVQAQVKKSAIKKKVTSTKENIQRGGVKRTKAVRIKITTDSGIIIVKLYDSTPLHRNNFVKLVKQGFFDSTLFHRIIPGFMIQGGDPLSKNSQPGAQLGMGGSDMERIPAEFKKSLIHKKGALAAASDGNPAKASSACQFYIVDGKQWADEELNYFEQSGGFKYTAAQRQTYKTIGGTAQLDMNYTVFGEVESGLEVVGKIANVRRDSFNRPTGDIRMKMEIIK